MIHLYQKDVDIFLFPFFQNLVCLKFNSKTLVLIFWQIKKVEKYLSYFVFSKLNNLLKNIIHQTNKKHKIKFY